MRKRWAIKGKTSHHLLRDYRRLRKEFWGRHLWARGYFCCSSGVVTDEVVKQYIESQRQDSDRDFRVDGEGPPKGNAVNLAVQGPTRRAGRLKSSVVAV